MKENQGKDDVFTKMGQLFIDCWGKLSDAIVHLDTEHGCREYSFADIEEMQKKYYEIVKEYQEKLFARPVQEEENQK